MTDIFDAPEFEPLTAREAEVLTALAHGKTYKQIALAWGVTHQAIGYHMSNVRGKLCAETNEEAIYKAVLAGLLPIPGGSDQVSFANIN